MDQHLDEGMAARVLQTQQIRWCADFAEHAVRFPEAGLTVSLFKAFAAEFPQAASRELSIGHLTGSAWLVSADGQRVLLTHHRKLDRWLQLGGHADGDADLARVALREAQEESGLSDLRIEGGIFDLDRHRIPARGDEPEHWHYDVRYVVRCTGSEDFVLSEESHALAWVGIRALAEADDTEASMRRMAMRWLARIEN